MSALLMGAPGVINRQRTRSLTSTTCGMPGRSSDEHRTSVMPTTIENAFDSMGDALEFASKLRKEHPWMIDPRRSKVMGYWDGATSVRMRGRRGSSTGGVSGVAFTRCGLTVSAVSQIALIFTALFTPFEVALIGSGDINWALFAVNRLIDLVFIIDMFLQVLPRKHRGPPRPRANPRRRSGLP
jgi:hypothetical protein